MKETVKNLLKVRNKVAERYGKIEEDEIKSKKGYAIIKWAKLIDRELVKVQEKCSLKYNQGKEDLEIDFALEKEVEGQKVLVKDDKGGYLYTRENTKLLKKALRELDEKITLEGENTEIEFEPYLIDVEVLGETDEEIIAELKGIFIK